MIKVLITLLVLSTMLFGQNRKSYVDSLFIWDGAGSTLSDYQPFMLKSVDTSEVKTLPNTIDGARVFIVNSGIGSGEFELTTSSYSLNNSTKGFVFDALASGKQWVRKRFKEDGYVSVKDYGAIPNDGNTDSEAFQNALNSGYDVYVPSGSYIVGGIELTRRGQRLFGVSRNRYNTPGSLLTVEADGDTMVAMGNAAGQLETRIENIAFLGNSGGNIAKVGIYMLDENSRNTVVNCYFEDFNRFYTNGIDTSYAILNNSVFSMELRDNVFYQNDVSIWAKNEVQASVFYNNKITSVYVIGLWLDGGKDIVWQGGTIEAGNTYSVFNTLIKLNNISATFNGLYTELGNTNLADTSVISSVNISNTLDYGVSKIVFSQGKLGGGSSFSDPGQHVQAIVRAENCNGRTNLTFDNFEFLEPAKYIVYSGNKRNVITTIRDSYIQDIGNIMSRIDYFSTSKDIDIYKGSSFGGNIHWMQEQNRFSKPVVIDNDNKMKSSPKSYVTLQSDLDGEIVSAYDSKHSMYLDGSDTLYFEETSLSNPGRDSFSWSLWYKTEDIRYVGLTTPVLFYDYLSSTNHLQLYQHLPGAGGLSRVPYVRIENNNQSFSQYIHGDFEKREYWTTPQDNIWHNVTFVRNASIDSLIVYIDGDKNMSIFLPDSNFAWSKNTYIMFNTKGNVDDVAMWDEALTASKVDTIWNGGKPINLQTSLNSTNLVLWWDFETLNTGASKDTVYDKVNNIAMLSGGSNTNSKATHSYDSPTQNSMISVMDSDTDKEPNFLLTRNGGIRVGSNGSMIDSIKVVSDTLRFYINSIEYKAIP